MILKTSINYIHFPLVDNFPIITSAWGGHIRHNANLMIINYGDVATGQPGKPSLGPGYILNGK